MSHTPQAANRMLSALALGLALSCPYRAGTLPTGSDKCPLACDTAGAANSPTKASGCGEVALRWSEAPTPLIIAHRGSGNIAAPENTWVAFDYAAMNGFALETDVRRSFDGVLVLMHDSDVGRTTGGKGTIETLSYGELLGLDAAHQFHPELFSPQPIPSYHDYIQRYACRGLLLPEVKGSPSDGARMAEAVAAVKAEATVLIQSFAPEALLQVRAAAPSILVALTSAAQVEPTVAQSYGVWAVLIEYGKLDAEYVARMQAAGVKVFAWTVDSITVAERLLAYGVDGIISNDPELIQSAYSFSPVGSTTVAVPVSLLGSAWRGYSSTGSWLPVAVDGYATFTGYGTIGDNDFSRLYLPGVRNSAQVMSQEILTTIKVAKAPASSDSSRHLGVRFNWSTDNDTAFEGSNDTVGYYLAYRVSGSVELARVTAGVVSILNVAAWNPLVEGQIVPLRIVATPDGVTVTRTDLGQEITLSDAQVPRGGFVGVYGSGIVPGIGETTITTLNGAP